MKLGAASRHLVGGGMDWSLRVIAKECGGSTVSIAGALG